MPSALEVLGWIAAVAAGVAGLVYLVKALRYVARGVRWLFDAIEVIHDLVTRELDHNHGSSMKDDLYGVAVALGTLQREHEEDRRRLWRALRLAAKHHPEDAVMYLGLVDERKPDDRHS